RIDVDDRRRGLLHQGCIGKLYLLAAEGNAACRLHIRISGVLHAPEKPGNGIARLPGFLRNCRRPKKSSASKYQPKEGMKELPLSRHLRILERWHPTLFTKEYAF